MTSYIVRESITAAKCHPLLLKNDEIVISFSGFEKQGHQDDLVNFPPIWFEDWYRNSTF